MNLDALAEKLLADIRLCDSRDEFDEVVRAALAQAERMGMGLAANKVSALISDGVDQSSFTAAIRAEMEKIK